MVIIITFISEEQINTIYISIHDPFFLSHQFDDALIEFAAEAKVPFSVFGSESFKKLIKVANKGIVVKHRTTYSRMIASKAKKVLQDVQDVIVSLKDSIVSVSFTTDIWTSRAGDSYIFFTVQFIDNQWKLHRWTPYVRNFPDRDILLMPLQFNLMR